MPWVVGRYHRIKSVVTAMATTQEQLERECTLGGCQSRTGCCHHLGPWQGRRALERGCGRGRQCHSLPSGQEIEEVKQREQSQGTEATLPTALTPEFRNLLIVITI